MMTPLRPTLLALLTVGFMSGNALAMTLTALGPLRRGWWGLSPLALPNVANVYVRLNLLLGRFPYHSKGILDSSHLRFYTRKSSEAMCVKTGWEIVGREYTSIPVAMVFPFLRKRAFRWLLHGLRGVTRVFKGLFGYQILLFCRNPNEADLL